MFEILVHLSPQIWCKIGKEGIEKIRKTLNTSETNTKVERNNFLPKPYAVYVTDMKDSGEITERLLRETTMQKIIEKFLERRYIQ